MEIILKEIFKKEKLEVNKEELAKQISQIKAMHQDVEDDNIRLYVENILMNEEVMKFLENL
jgi:FKBP-type peptidyl-prolyl cis-trans isomerase (trigger factor)